MHARRVSDSHRLFPSPQRGEKDIPAKTFRESLWFACDAAKVPGLASTTTGITLPASQCVMTGIDFIDLGQGSAEVAGGVLAAAVGVKEQVRRWLLMAQGHVEGVEDQRRVNPL